MRRFEMDDERFRRIEPLLPGKPADPGATARDTKLFLDALLRIARTGAPWPDLPARFGKHDTVDRRFDRRAKKGTWGRILEALGGDADPEDLLIDTTVVRAHRHAAGIPKNRGIGPSAGRAAG